MKKTYPPRYTWIMFALGGFLMSVGRHAFPDSYNEFFLIVANQIQAGAFIRYIYADEIEKEF